MDVILKINGVDISNRLSSYVVTEEIAYQRVIKTLDEQEHPYPGYIRPIVLFTLIPGTSTEDNELYNELKEFIVTAEYMHRDAVYTRSFRVTSNLESTFLLMSVDGKRRYRSGEISLRGI